MPVLQSYIWETYVDIWYILSDFQISDEMIRSPILSRKTYINPSYFHIIICALNEFYVINNEYDMFWWLFTT